MSAEFVAQAREALDRGEPQQALSHLQSLGLAIEKDYDALLIAANAHEALGHPRKAATRYAQAAEVSPETRQKELAFKAASIFLGCRMYKRAAKALIIALQVDPGDPELLASICNIYRDIGDLHAALPYCGVLFSTARTFSQYLSAGLILNGLERFGDAYTMLKKARAEDANDRVALVETFWAASNLGDLPMATALQIELEHGYAAEGDAPDIRENAFRALMWTGDETLLAHYARRTADVALPPVQEPGEYNTQVDGKEPGIIRVGYVSCDYYDHATMSLLAGILEHHDRDRFEIFAFCHTAEAKRDDAMHDRMLETVDFYVDILDKTDTEAAELVREMGIDVLVDLKGFTHGSRLGIFCRRPAPVQVTWLGYPGSVTGAGIDYAITDKFVTPDTSTPFYQEKLMRVEGSYQCNDSARERVSRSGSRSEHGLPDDAIVFCSFNHTAKIRIPVFSAWMEILSAVDNSVLWLGLQKPPAQENLRAAAQSAGIDPERLIFAKSIPPLEHIRRLPQADIALDTSPCNGHTTTADALWAGLPVITVKGTSFAGRVSESLLNAVGLPELVADDLEAYKALAISLAKDEGRLARLKSDLIDARDTAPLFDTETKTRQIEALYLEMLEEKRGQALET